MKFSICESAQIGYKRDGCNWSIIKGTVLEGQRTISAVTRIPLEGLY